MGTAGHCSFSPDRPLQVAAGGICTLPQRCDRRVQQPQLRGYLRATASEVRELAGVLAGTDELIDALDCPLSLGIQDERVRVQLGERVAHACVEIRRRRLATLLCGPAAPAGRHPCTENAGPHRHSLPVGSSHDNAPSGASFVQSHPI